MKFMRIKSSPPEESVRELYKSVIKSKKNKNYSGTSVIDLILRERPHFVSLKLKEPVNGNDDMMTMLGSLDENIRLRVSVIDTELIKGYFVSVFQGFRNFILLGRRTQKFDTIP